MSQKSKITSISSEIAFIEAQETKVLRHALSGAGLRAHRLANEAKKNFKDKIALVNRETGTKQTKLFE